jgi:hypothetical protein
MQVLVFGLNDPPLVANYFQTHTPTTKMCTARGKPTELDLKRYHKNSTVVGCLLVKARKKDGSDGEEARLKLCSCRI